MSTICVYCRGDAPGITEAERHEISWERHPIEVQERTCVVCYTLFHWWYFVKGGKF